MVWTVSSSFATKSRPLTGWKEDRTVEDNVGGQQVGESFGRWLRAAHVFERMTCQANSLGALETAGCIRAEVWRASRVWGAAGIHLLLADDGSLRRSLELDRWVGVWSRLGLHTSSPISPRGGGGNTARTTTPQARGYGSAPGTGPSLTRRSLLSGRDAQPVATNRSA